VQYLGNNNDTILISPRVADTFHTFVLMNIAQVVLDDRLRTVKPSANKLICHDTNCCNNIFYSLKRYVLLT